MERPIRVAYFDLGFSKEQYGLQPTKYGGGAVLARYLKEDPTIDFFVFAPSESFENVARSERGDRCISLPKAVCEALRLGYPISEIGGLDVSQFDLIVHPHTCETINRGKYRGPIVHFCGFDGSAGHPGNDYVLFYDDSFIPKFGEKPKYVRIGKPVPQIFVPNVKADYVFQCSRHDEAMNSIEAARACLESGIHGYFAGPIHGGYPLLQYIDNRTTFYLGEVDESTKLGYCRHAKLFTLLHNWDVPFNQSVIEAQGQGTPIFVRPRGPFFAKYLKDGINGFSCEKHSFIEAFNNSLSIDQKKCWESARAYDVEIMTESFKKAFYEIYQEWKKS